MYNINHINRPIANYVFLVLVFAALYTLLGENPYDNVSGAFRGRFALTVAMVEDQSFKVTDYKSYLGNDQSIVDGERYCAHDPGLSLIMTVPYLVFTKPVTWLLEKRGHRVNMHLKGNLTRLVVFNLLGPVLFLYLLHLFKEFFNTNRWYEFPLLFFSTMIPLYNTYVYADLFSALFQFPVIYYLFRILHNKRLTTFDHVILFSSIFLVIWIKAVNGLFIVPIALLLLYKKEYRYFLMVGTVTAFSSILLLSYHYSITNIPFEFVGKYYSPRGNGIFPNLEVAGRSSRFDLSKFSMGKLFDLLFDVRSGLITYNSCGIIIFVAFFKKYRDPAVIMLFAILVFFLVFFLGFFGWDMGASYGWRNSMPMIPSLLLLSFVALKYLDTYVRYIYYIWITVNIVFTFPVYLCSPWILPVNRISPTSFYLERMANEKQLSLIGHKIIVEDFYTSHLWALLLLTLVAGMIYSIYLHLINTDYFEMKKYP